MRLYHHRGSWEVNREEGTKYLSENQLKLMLLILCYEIKKEAYKRITCSITQQNNSENHYNNGKKSKQLVVLVMFAGYLQLC